VSGDHRAFLDATLPHLDAVHRVATHLTRQPADADDLAQETYLRAFAGFAGHHGQDTRAWLVAICLNTARSQARRVARRPQETLCATPAEDVPASTPDVSDTVLANLDREALTAALMRLPEPQRACVVLMDLAGLTAAEVATILSCPRGTVLARVHRGRRVLGRLLLAEGVRRDRA